MSCCKAGERNQWTTRKVFWVNVARKHSCVCRGSLRTTGIVGRRSDAHESRPTTAGCKFLNTSSIVVIHYNYSMTDRVYTNYSRFTCTEARLLRTQTPVPSYTTPFSLNQHHRSCYSEIPAFQITVWTVTSQQLKPLGRRQTKFSMTYSRQDNTSDVSRSMHVGWHRFTH